MTDAPEKEVKEDAVAEETAAAPSIVFDKPREKTIPLIHKFSIDGERVESIRLRRASGIEVARYVGQLAAGEDVLPPVIDCSMTVYNTLDDEDLERIDKESKNFLSPRLREVLTPTPETSGSS